MTLISLVDVAKHYRGLKHQQQALEFLQSKVSPETLEEFAGIWRSPPEEPEFLTLDQLMQITTVAPRKRLEQFIKPLNQGFAKFEVNTPLRIAHFLAQTLHESGEFRYQEELASGADYQGREDLGNLQAGDGVRFKGRGLIQVTGRFNYTQISKDLGFDYVANPERLAELPDCVNSAFWYWNSRSLNQLADRDKFELITRRINGGVNGWDDRLKYLNRAKEVLI